MCVVVAPSHQVHKAFNNRFSRLSFCGWGAFWSQSKSECLWIWFWRSNNSRTKIYFHKRVLSAWDWSVFFNAVWAKCRWTVASDAVLMDWRETVWAEILISHPKSPVFSFSTNIPNITKKQIYMNTSVWWCRRRGTQSQRYDSRSHGKPGSYSIYKCKIPFLHSS